MINEVLEKCVVERLKDCAGIRDLRAMVIAFVNLIEHGGQFVTQGSAENRVMSTVTASTSFAAEPILW